MTMECVLDIRGHYAYPEKIIVGLLAFFVVLGIAGFLIAPPLVKPLIIKKMSEALHRKVSLEKSASILMPYPSL